MYVEFSIYSRWRMFSLLSILDGEYSVCYLFRAESVQFGVYISLRVINLLSVPTRQ